LFFILLLDDVVEVDRRGHHLRELLVSLVIFKILFLVLLLGTVRFSILHLHIKINSCLIIFKSLRRRLCLNLKRVLDQHGDISGLLLH
jgi:hypothetical protein